MYVPKIVTSILEAKKLFPSLTTEILWKKIKDISEFILLVEVKLVRGY